jgi:hypothetical protein
VVLPITPSLLSFVPLAVLPPPPRALKFCSPIRPVKLLVLLQIGPYPFELTLNTL